MTLGYRKTYNEYNKGKVKYSLETYIEIINFLKEIKVKVKNKNYTKKEDLGIDFNKTLSLVWETLDDLYKEDLTNLYQVQKFLIDEVCNIHEEENSSINKETFEENINIKDVCNKLEDGKRAFNIYSLNDSQWDQYLIGDIHSDTISTRKILEKTDFFNRVGNGEKVRLVFLGDYVDRGKAHLKTIQYILTLKYLFPKNIILQQGNHDGGSFKDGKVKMWVRMSEKALEADWFLHYLYNLASENHTFPIDYIDDVLRFFNSLSNLTFICHEDKTMLLTHGGIPRPRKEKNFYSYLTSISSLTDENIKDNLGKTIVGNMMWSDPSEVNKDLKEDNGRFRFTEEHFKEFRDLIGFDILVRGHEVQEKGYKHYFNDRLINIFSSGKIIEDGKNINIETAYSRVKNPHIINIDRKGQLRFIGLNV